MFRQLNEKEAAEFRLWARANYMLGTEISELWHPVVQNECRQMCEENGIWFDAANGKSPEKDFGFKK